MSDQDEPGPNISYKIPFILLPIQSNVKSIVSFIHRAVERIFAKTGNSLNVVKDDGFTTLHIAAINDHREIAKILLTKVIYKKKSTDFSLFFVNCNLYFFFSRLRLPVWLNSLNRFERLSTVFNLGAEYNFLCVVCWDIRRSFYVCSPIVKIRKTKSGHLYLRSVHCKN